MTALRRMIAGLFLALTVTCASLAQWSAWFSQSILDTAAFRQTATSLVQSPDFQKVVAAQLADALRQQKIPIPPNDAAMLNSFSQVVAQPAFQQAVISGLVQLHDTVLSPEKPPVITIDMSAFVGPVAGAASKVSPEIGAAIPAVGLPALQIPTAGIPSAAAYVDDVRAAPGLLSLAAAVCLGLGLAISPNRSRHLRRTGLGLLFVGLGFLIMRFVAPMIAGAVTGDNSSSDLLRAVYSTMLTGLLRVSLVTAGIGAVLLALGMFWGWNAKRAKFSDLKANAVGAQQDEQRLVSDAESTWGGGAWTGEQWGAAPATAPAAGYLPTQAPPQAPAFTPPPLYQPGNPAGTPAGDPAGAPGYPAAYPTSNPLGPNSQPPTFTPPPGYAPPPANGGW